MESEVSVSMTGYDKDTSKTDEMTMRRQEASNKMCKK